MDAIIDTLEAALAELEAKAMASSTSFHTTPILLIQPPASRAVHAERLDVFAKRLGVTHGSVSSLCGRLGSIKEKLETVGAQIFRQQCCCTSARSPVSSLPPELLLKVFAVAQSDDPFVVRKIMCVSSRWRQAAMQERSLWRRINIPVDQLSIIQSPTSLTPFIGDPIHAVFTSRAWRSMAPEVGSALLRRLVTANIQGSSGPAVLGAITNCVDDEDASFSALEELQLEMPVDSDSGHVVRGEGPSPLYSYNARAMPCLRTLTLRRCLFEMMEPTSITDLTIASVETQIVHFEDVLTSCHRLVSLRIDDTIVIGELIEQRILLSELRSLEIRREGGPDAGVILAHIAAPALRSFIMHDVQVSETGAHDFEVGEITNEALIFEEVRFLVCCIAFLCLRTLMLSARSLIRPNWKPWNYHPKNSV